MVPQERRSTWSRVRPGAHRVELDDDGTTFFLYDDASRALISHTPAAPGSDRLAAFEDPRGDAMRALANLGLVVAYEQQSEPGAALEVHVGPPFEPLEVAQLRLLPVQRSFLKLPSGGLCVEGYEALSIPPYTPSRDAERAVVEVPPGNYLVTLHHSDRAGSPPPGPTQLLVLTPTRAESPPEPPPPLLLYDDAEKEALRALGLGQGQVEGRTYLGRIQFRPQGQDAFVDLTPRAGEALGLEDGTALRIEVPEIPFALLAYYVDDYDRRGPALVSAASNVELPAELGPEVALGGFEMTPMANEPFLYLRRVRGTGSVPADFHARWVPARVTPDPAIPIPDELILAW